MKNINRIIALGCVLVVMMSQSLAAKKLNIVTTLPSLKSITESVGGEHVKVYSITHGSQDAHYIEAKPSYMIKLNKADLLIYSGLELEIGWLPLLIQGARNNKVTPGSLGNLNAASALPADIILERPAGEVDRSMGDVHPGGNPHYLINPNNGVRVAELIAERLINLDTKNKAAYEQNLAQFTSEMNAAINTWKTQTQHLQNRGIVCYHVHWSYLLDWLQLNQQGLIELRPGIPPSPKHKQYIIERIKNKQIEVVIVSSWKEPTRAREVAQATGAKLLILPGEVDAMKGTDSYFKWIDYLTTQLAQAYPANTTPVRAQIQQRERKRGQQ